MARMDLTRWTPFAELQLMRDFLNSGEWPGGKGRPIALDVYDKDHKLVVTADIPGIAKGDLKITVDEGVLTIRAEYQDEETVEDGHYYLHEAHRGSMTRSLRLPGKLDTTKAEAVHKNGRLTITFPHMEGDEGVAIELTPE